MCPPRPPSPPGAWWDVEEGTNPVFLYQQNTVRDALIVSLHLDIFHRHAERVIIANPWQKDEIKDRGENVKDLAGSMPADWLGSLAFSPPPDLVNKVWENLDSLPASSRLVSAGRRVFCSPG